MSVFPVLPDGRLSTASGFVQHYGSTADPDRQEIPHAHAVVISPDNRYALVADLGLGKVFSYRFDLAKGSIAPNDPPFTVLEPGSGPRHFAFHPKGELIYVISEIASTVTALSYHRITGALHHVQTTSTIPMAFSGHNDAAEVQIDSTGRFLYVSNRGSDTIRTFAIDADSGTLTAVNDVPVEGKNPRHFAIDPTGNYLFVANEVSDSIVIFHIDRKTGQLTQAGDALAIASPACLVFSPRV
jgi:6-phosphogluconolactonase